MGTEEGGRGRAAAQLARRSLSKMQSNQDVVKTRLKKLVCARARTDEVESEPTGPWPGKQDLSTAAEQGEKMGEGNKEGREEDGREGGSVANDEGRGAGRSLHPSFNSRDGMPPRRVTHSFTHSLCNAANSLAQVKIRLFCCAADAAVAKNNYAMERWISRSVSFDCNAMDGDVKCHPSLPFSPSTIFELNL